MAEVFETDVYRGQAERALTEEERVALRLLVVADPWAGRPSGIDPALFRMKWRNHDVWYTFSQDAEKVTLIALTAHGETIADKIRGQYPFSNSKKGTVPLFWQGGYGDRREGTGRIFAPPVWRIRPRY